MNILVAAPDNLGEIVCSTAVLRCLGHQLPHAVVHYWVTPEWAAAVAHHPSVGHLHAQSDDPGFLPSIPFDVVVDLRADRHLRRWARRCGMQYLGINASFLVSFLSNHFGWVPEGGSQPMATRFFEAVKPLGVRDDGRGPEYLLDANDQVHPSDLPLSHSAGYLALVVGDADYDAAVPLRLLQAFCKAMDHPLVLVSSRGNNETARHLEAADPIKVYNACGKFTLNETADLLRKARLVISPETGLMQVAAAFGRPMVVLRSSNESGMYYPPFYGSPAGAIRPKYAPWIWPEPVRNAFRQKGTATRQAQTLDTCVQNGLGLVRQLLRQQGNLSEG